MSAESVFFPRSFQSNFNARGIPWGSNTIVHYLFVTLVCSIASFGSSVGAAPFGYSNDNRNLYTVDLSSGSSTLVGPTGVGGDFEAMAFDPTSGLLYAYDDRGSGLYTVDTSTGAFSLVGGTRGVFNGRMTFDQAGQGYVIGDTELYALDKSTGATTLIGSGTLGLSSIAAVGPSLFALGDNGSTFNLISVDPLTGAQSSVGALGFNPTEQTGLAYDGDSDTLYALDETTESLYTVDYTTGAATFVSVVPFLGGPFESLAISSVVVPEASTLLLTSFVLVVVVGFRRFLN